MKKLFSIVVPVYNALPTLPDTLSSVLAQDCPDWELIIVNDGSTDGSSAWLKQWCEDHRDRAISLIEQENRGLGAARNRGIAEAGGQWIALLDADDRWLPEKLSRAATWVEQVEFDLAYHSARTFGLSSERLRQAIPLRSIRQLLTLGNPIIPSTVIVRRDLILRHPFSEDAQFHGAEDLHLWIKFLEQDYQLRGFREELACYRETEGMSTRIEEHLQKVLAVIDHYFEAGYYGEGLRRQAKQRKYYEAARFFHKRGHFEAAAQNYRKATPLPARARLLALLNRLKISL